MPDRREGILLEQIIDCDLPLMLNVRIGAADRFFIEKNTDEPPLHSCWR
jgi:hypothetical protein